MMGALLTQPGGMEPGEGGEAWEVDWHPEPGSVNGELCPHWLWLGD